MYGLVNKAIQDMVSARFGADTWETIRSKAGLELDSFVRMSQYPDSLTYALVTAASEELQLSVEEILVSFGEYWTLYSAQEGYGELLAMCGDSLVEFLKNLDAMHTRVGLSFTELRPPSFRCVELDDSTIELQYFSFRPGLAPFVVGLIQGLGRRFDTEVDIELVRTRDDGADFRIQHRPATS